MINISDFHKTVCFMQTRHFLEIDWSDVVKVDFENDQHAIG